MDSKKTILIIFAAIIMLACFGFGKEVLATTYYATGTLTSTNLLSVKTVGSIDYFGYNCDVADANVSLTVQFNQDGGSTWYKADKTSGSTDLLDGDHLTSNRITLSDWTAEDKFYYKMAFATDDTSKTPTLYEIRVYYTSNTAPNTPSNPSPADGTTDVATSTTLSVDVYDAEGDAMTVSFYKSDDSLIATTSVAASGSTSTATTTWSELSGATTYQWYTVANDGIESATSSTWSFETNKAPTGLYSLNIDSISTSSADLSWSEVVEPNFDLYEIWYGTSSADVSGRTDSAASTTIGTKSTTQTTIDGLAANNTYYFKIWAKDDSGNESTVPITSGETVQLNFFDIKNLFFQNVNLEHK